MPDVVSELLITEAALDKLGTPTISAEETEQLLHNDHVTVRNPRDETASGTRRLLIGRTDGGRALTLVIEQTLDPTHVKHLAWLGEQLGQRLRDAVIITTGPTAYRRSDGIAVVPAALLGP